MLLLQFHYKVVVKQMWHQGVEIANYLLQIVHDKVVFKLKQSLSATV